MTGSSKLFIPAGFEARGFIFGAPLALALKCAFVPFRKPGKLPGLPVHLMLCLLCIATCTLCCLTFFALDFLTKSPTMRCESAFMLGQPACLPYRLGACAGETIGASYQLEYGEDRIEMHTGAISKGQRVVLIDDLIATGGTLAAGVKLMEQAGCPASAAFTPALLHKFKPCTADWSRCMQRTTCSGQLISLQALLLAQTLTLVCCTRQWCHPSMYY